MSVVFVNGVVNPSSAVLKSSADWQLAQWVRWPLEAQWPGVMDLYEAAAFRRVHPSTIRRACMPGRDKRAELPHQRIGVSYRITKSALQNFGAVKERAVA